MAICIIAYYTIEYLGPESWSLSLTFSGCVVDVGLNLKLFWGYAFPGPVVFGNPNIIVASTKSINY